MMKILTQKMLGAQGLERLCQDFVTSSEAGIQLFLGFTGLSFRFTGVVIPRSDRDESLP
jgi:hypothetical protein